MYDIILFFLSKIMANSLIVKRNNKINMLKLHSHTHIVKYVQVLFSYVLCTYKYSWYTQIHSKYIICTYLFSGNGRVKSHNQTKVNKQPRLFNLAFLTVINVD